MGKTVKKETKKELENTVNAETEQLIEEENEIEQPISEESITQIVEELKHEADTMEDPIDTSLDSEADILKKKSEALKTEVLKQKKPIEINENKKIDKVRLFFVSDMDEEAEYLHTMSVQGNHFLSKKGIRYTFTQAEPKNYYYHLGYYEKDKRDGERYVDNYSEAGWENIFHEKGEFDGVWNYFRIEAADGAEAPEIFSDKVSRMALYERLLKNWRSLIALIVICFIFMAVIGVFLLTHDTAMTTILIALWSFVIIVLIAALLLYLRVYFKISRKLKEFKYI